MAADLVIASHHNTFSVATTGNTVQTRNFRVRIRNLGANAVSFSEISAPTGAVTAGQQSSVIPAGASAKVDDCYLWPNTLYNLKAATGATLVAFDEESSYPS